MDQWPLPVFRLLGPLDVAVGDRRVPIRSAKQRILLCSLLLNANRPVTVEELIDRLWAHPPGDARGTAQVHLGRLRHTLAASGAPGGLIRTDPHGYLIEVDDDHLDLARFAALTDAARREPGGHREATLLREALALWRGRPLSDVPSDHLQRSDVPRLVEQRLQAAERRYELELELGTGGEVIGELRELATAEPFRERLWALLMTALYWQGRQREAVECYHECAAVLREEIGLDPGPELRDLHEAILRGTVRFPGSRPRGEVRGQGRGQGRGEARGATGRWSVRPRAMPCQLPPEIGDFVGRSDELRQITGHFTWPRPDESVPIVAVVGAPGVGKTELAVKAAHALRQQFPDGQLYVRLGDSAGHPRNRGDRGDPLDAIAGSAAMLRERLADRRVLVVVDDVADAARARAVLPGTRGCGVLLTSRQRLVELPGIERVRPGPFDPEEALAFLERLIGADRVGRELALAQEIALLAGHLPLALRIVGARLALRPSQSLARLAAALRDESRRLDELATRNLRMRSALDTSYEALDPPAQRLLCRLGALRGEFDERTALALADDHGTHVLDRLVEANLVEPVGTGPSGESHYRVFDLVGIHAVQYGGKNHADGSGRQGRQV